MSKKKNDTQRKPLGLVLLVAGVVVAVLGVWLLTRPDSYPTAGASARTALITPDYTKLGTRSVLLAEQPTRSAATPLAKVPVVTNPAAKGSSEDVRRITPAELQRLLGEPNPPLVWELRSPVDYEKQHIEGSRLVKLNEVNALAESLDRKQPIVTNCD
jgi:hypothetical protein